MTIRLIIPDFIRWLILTQTIALIIFVSIICLLYLRKVLKGYGSLKIWHVILIGYGYITNCILATEFVLSKVGKPLDFLTVLIAMTGIIATDTALVCVFAYINHRFDEHELDEIEEKVNGVNN